MKIILVRKNVILVALFWLISCALPVEPNEPGMNYLQEFQQVKVDNWTIRNDTLIVKVSSSHLFGDGVIRLTYTKSSTIYYVGEIKDINNYMIGNDRILDIELYGVLIPIY